MPIGPSQARNAIKKALYSVFDRYPTKSQINELWRFFESRCAYCGLVLDRESRQGHADHLVAVATGGSNHLSNIVLSCNKCNGDFKREVDWEIFLRQKYSDEQGFTVRRDHILRWVDINGGTVPHRDPELTRFVNDQVDIAIEAFNGSLARIRVRRTRPNLDRQEER